MSWTQWGKIAGFEFKEMIYEKKYHEELGGGIARMTINREHRMNAFTAKLTEEMAAAFYNASNDPMIGVVILTGAGDRAFCVGGDVQEEKEWAADTGRLLPAKASASVQSCV